MLLVDAKISKKAVNMVVMLIGHENQTLHNRHPKDDPGQHLV